ncbi:MAG: hypothetical protein WDZ36_02005, partial [Balneolaceae bacterium]
GTPNYREGVEKTGRYRTINRKKWPYTELEEHLEDSDSTTHRVFTRYCNLIRERRRHPAFHPMGDQRVYDVGEAYVCILRTAPDERESILVIANVTGKPKILKISRTELPIAPGRKYQDEITGEMKVRDGEVRLNPFDVIWIRV